VFFPTATWLVSAYEDNGAYSYGRQLGWSVLISEFIYGFFNVSLSLSLSLSLPFPRPVSLRSAMKLKRKKKETNYNMFQVTDHLLQQIAQK
jgi:hypothetical protein